MLIDAKTSGVSLAATDLDVSVVAQHPAIVKTPGSVTLDAKQLYDIVWNLKHPKVTLVTSENARVTITCGPEKFSMLATSPEEYPLLPSSENVAFVSLETRLLAELIDHTLYAASNDETRYNLNGVYIEESEGHHIRFVATDGHRLSMMEKPFPGPAKFLGKGIIVPRKGIAEIRKLCDEADGSLELGLGEGFLLVRRSDLVLTARLIDGEFPNYRQILPTTRRIQIFSDRERLLHAMQHIALVQSKSEPQLVRFTLKGGTLELFATNPDLGEVCELLAVAYQGDRFETAFNARYVLDILSAMNAKEILIELTEEPAIPAKFRPTDDPSEMALIIPIVEYPRPVSWTTKETRT